MVCILDSSYACKSCACSNENRLLLHWWSDPKFWCIFDIVDVCWYVIPRIVDWGTFTDALTCIVYSLDIVQQIQTRLRERQKSVKEKIVTKLFSVNERQQIQQQVLYGILITDYFCAVWCRGCWQRWPYHVGRINVSNESNWRVCVRTTDEETDWPVWLQQEWNNRIFWIHQGILVLILSFHIFSL